MSVKHLSIIAFQNALTITMIIIVSVIVGYYLIWRQANAVPNTTRIVATIPLIVIGLLLTGAIVLANLQIV